MKIKILYFIVILSAMPAFSLKLNAQTKLNKFVSPENKSAAGLSKTSKVEYPGDSTIDVTYYKLNLTLNYYTHNIKGAVTVNANSKSSGLSGFFLDLQDPLTVDSVVSPVGGKLKFTHANAKLSITLGGTYNYGQGFSVTVYYHGVPGSSGFGSFVFGQHNGSPVIWSLSEPYGASDWWPCKDTPADKADSSDVWVTCDNLLTAASNGVLQEVVHNADGTNTYKWKNSYPIAQYLISIAVSNYYIYTIYYHYAANDSMPIVNYIYPEHFAQVKPYLDMLPQMIKIYADRYGQYPFIKEKYGEAEFGWGGGMEHQTMTSLGAFGEDIEAHELAHQWFGDKITCADWQDIWLNEGFATYSEAVHYEATQGETAYKSMIASDMNAAKNAVGSIYVQNIFSVNSIFDGARSYSKGAVVLHMLRGITGDSTFFRILRTYADDPQFAYGVATTRDFESVAESVYGSSLRYFFNEWIFGEGYPKYDVSWNYDLSGDGTYNVNLHIKQSINSDPLFFTMPVQIKINTDTGDTTVTVFNNMQDQQFSIKIKSKPQYLTFDPNNLILKDLSIVDSVDLTKPESFSLEQNYPNPFNPDTKIRYSIPVEQQGYVPVKLTVYDATGRLVATLVDKQQSAGSYIVIFPTVSGGEKLASGVYFYTLSAGSFRQTKSMVLLK